jgi:hypothetical protein
MVLFLLIRRFMKHNPKLKTSPYGSRAMSDDVSYRELQKQVSWQCVPGLVLLDVSCSTWTASGLGQGSDDGDYGAGTPAPPR